MKILVCAKQVPDTTEVEMDENHSLVRDFVSQIINPADESALELAFQLRDAQGGTVSVVSMGRKSAETMLREAACRGADELLLLCDPAFAGADTYATALTLTSAVRRMGGYDLILCGRRAVDGETGQVGPELAAMLDIPVLSNVTHLDCEKDGWKAVRLLEGGAETLAFAPPALITVCEWSYALRLPTISGLRRAKDVPVLRMGPNDVGLSQKRCGLRGSPTRVVSVEARKSGIRHPDLCFDAAQGAEEALRRMESAYG